MDVIRSRIGLIALIFFGIVLFSPTPVPVALVDSIMKAKIAGASGRPGSVLEYLEDAISRDAQLTSLHLTISEAALAVDDIDLARESFSHVQSNDIRSTCVDFDIRINQADIVGALETWDRNDFDCQIDTQLLWDLTQELISEMEFQLAGEFLAKLSLQLPTNAEIQFHQGLLLATVSPETSLGLLRLANELAPSGNSIGLELVRTIEDSRVVESEAYALAQVGQVLAKYGFWPYAARAFRSAIEWEPTYADAHAFLGLALDEMGENGYEAYQHAIDFAGDNALPHIYLGMHWLRNGYPEIALTKFERASELEPDNPIIAIQIGHSYELMGEIEIALDAYRIATEISPQNPAFWLILAQASLSNERNVLMIGQPAARNAVALDPENPNAVDALGYSYYLQGDLDYADRLITRAVELDPLNPHTQYHLGLLRAAQNEYLDSKAAFEMAIRLDPNGSVGTLAERALETISQ
jgi:tetratricopeptide (TPR) repeat protein